MTSSNLSWQEAIIRVLEGAGEPLHYQEVTNQIGQQGLRPLTGSTPAGTVNAHLSRMIKEDDSIYDQRISKAGRGIFEFIHPSLDTSPELEDSDETDVEEPDDVREHLIPAFGLFWERDKVRWNSSQILGRQASIANPVNFAEQQGVYLLHNGRSVVYVGRAIQNSLYNRLRNHNRETDSKALRWDCFSWFGLRDVDDTTGRLQSFAGHFSMSDLITILESVLIEALEPPINGRRGDRMGELYQQVIDPQIQENLRREYFASLAR